MAEPPDMASRELSSTSKTLVSFSLPLDEGAKSPKSPKSPKQSSMSIKSAPLREGGGLGDFSKLWEFMASIDYTLPSSSLTKDAPGLSDGPSSYEDGSFTDRDNYVSDGAAYRPPQRVILRREDHSDASANELGLVDDDDDVFSSTRWDSATKSKLKAPGKGSKKRAAAAARAARHVAVSDVEVEKSVQLLKRSAPAHKASNHSTPSIASNENGHRYPLRSQDQISKIPSTPRKSEMKKNVIKTTSPIALVSDFVETNIVAKSVISTSHELQQSLKKQFSGRAIPPHVSVTTASFSASLPRPAESTIREKYERDIAFRLFLIQTFPEQRESLAQTITFKDHNRSPAALHVFIDFSNIWIGFMEHIKLLMGIPSSGRLPEELRNLSFDSLVFLLERGRPVSRQVLVGSAPRIPAFDMAERIGYEVNILEKVLKARDLFPRQKRELYNAYRQGSSQAMPNASAPIQIANNGSSIGRPGITVPSSATATGPSAALSTSPEKWVEQGVDEILQMKMMESILDAATPATIVLATGDGAKAEYSDGFLRAVERALRNGWTVELVSWSHGTSSQYRKASWLAQWKPGQFQFIELDMFTEYLLETPGAMVASR